MRFNLSLTATAISYVALTRSASGEFLRGRITHRAIVRTPFIHETRPETSPPKAESRKLKVESRKSKTAFDFRLSGHCVRVLLGLGKQLLLWAGMPPDPPKANPQRIAHSPAVM